VPRFLMDECMSPRLVAKLWDRGMDTIHVRDRGMLGSPDHEVWRYAQSENRTVCTINANDFRKIAASQGSDHAGVIAIAGGADPAGQFDMTMAALNWVDSTSNSGSGFLNRYIEVDEDGEIIFAEIHYFD
jgi:predicted nuclease of predicted toxin-antitoxin system